MTQFLANQGVGQEPKVTEKLLGAIISETFERI
jgi:hypothetical protein